MYLTKSTNLQRQCCLEILVVSENGFIERISLKRISIARAQWALLKCSSYLVLKVKSRTQRIPSRVWNRNNSTAGAKNICTWVTYLVTYRPDHLRRSKICHMGQSVAYRPDHLGRSNICHMGHSVKYRPDHLRRSNICTWVTQWGDSRLETASWWNTV